MSNLIDRAKLFGGFFPQYFNPEHKDYGDFHKGWNTCNDAWIRFIKEQPTAYDVDKVVERLEKRKQETFDEDNIYVIRAIYGEAIDIVKEGASC